MSASKYRAANTHVQSGAFCYSLSSSDIARPGPAGAARISHPHRRGKSFVRSVESEYRVWCSIIRANKPVPECRTESHAVSDIPLDDCIRRPRCYGVGRSDTSSDSVALPGSQEVRRFESLRLHPPESCQKLNVLAVEWPCFVSVRSPMLRAWLEPVCGAGPVGRSWSPRQRSIAWGVSMSGHEDGARGLLRYLGTAFYKERCSRSASSSGSAGAHLGS
jgi:hypothetical protein